MSNEASNQTIIDYEKVFPLNVKELKEIIEIPCELFDVNDNDSFTSIVVSSNIPICENCLFIPYHESDVECIRKKQEGAKIFLTDRKIDSLPCIVVDNLTMALYKICKYLVDIVRVPSIVIAGSEGKTTTKRMINNVLRQEMKTWCELENYNSLQSLCCALQEMECGTQMIIREVDEKRENSIHNNSDILRPDVAVITNIAEAHIGIYGSKEALISQFEEMIVGKDGIIIYNADDPDSLRAKFAGKTISVGIYNKTCDCVATNISEKKEGIEFDLTYQNKTDHVELSMHGEHNVYNAMMAYLVGTIKGIKKESILKGLRDSRNFGIRQNIVTVNDVTVYADCYNASARSIKYALDCFSGLVSYGRKIAVIGDIGEIDGFEENVYNQISDIVNNSEIDELITYGSKSKLIDMSIKKDIRVNHADNSEQLGSLLKAVRNTDPNNYLFKASRMMKLETIIESCFPEHYDKIMREEKQIVKISR